MQRNSKNIPGAGEQNSERFQILALDGGGSKGVFIAALLAGLESDLERPMIDHFDLVVGTSTGGIIALGLGAGLAPREIVDFYVKMAPQAFPNPKPPWRRIFRSKYDGSGLAAALRHVVGDKKLGESSLPLVVPAYNLAENCVHVFKTPHHPRFKRDWQIPMWEVAVATSAAPTFFPAHRLSNGGDRLIDGCVWANNPVMVGVVEAASYFGQRLEDVRVFSVGSTANARSRRRRYDDSGFVSWLRHKPDVFELMLAAQAAGAHSQAQLLVGKLNVLRLDPLNLAKTCRSTASSPRP